MKARKTIIALLTFMFMLFGIGTINALALGGANPQTGTPLDIVPIIIAVSALVLLIALGVVSFILKKKKKK